MEIANSDRHTYALYTSVHSKNIVVENEANLKYITYLCIFSNTYQTYKTYHILAFEYVCCVCVLQNPI